MISYRCYKVDSLLTLLGNGFFILNKTVQDNFSDWVTGGVDTEGVMKFYITNLTNIQEIEEWRSLWNSTIVNLTDGTKLKFHSSNINSGNESLLRINENNCISPSFTMQENCILASNDLDDWLMFNGISKDLLDSITVGFNLNPTYIYKDIPEPVIRNNKICGCYSQSMKLTEDKIDTALSDIQDVEMRLKIESIVKSFTKVWE